MESYCQHWTQSNKSESRSFLIHKTWPHIKERLLMFGAQWFFNDFLSLTSSFKFSYFWETKPSYSLKIQSASLSLCLCLPPSSHTPVSFTTHTASGFVSRYTLIHVPRSTLQLINNLEAHGVKPKQVGCKNNNTTMRSYTVTCLESIQDEGELHRN